MKYGAIQWKGVRMERARRTIKSLARKQERQVARKEIENEA